MESGQRMSEISLVKQWGVATKNRQAFRNSFSKVGSSRSEFTNRTLPMSLLSASWTPTDRTSIPKLVRLHQYDKRRKLDGLSVMMISYFFFGNLIDFVDRSCYYARGGWGCNGLVCSNGP